MISGDLSDHLSYSASSQSLNTENILCFALRSLRKVMLRTCIGADGTAPAKDYPHPPFAENKIRFENGNGDLVNHHRPGGGRLLHGGSGVGANHWGDPDHGAHHGHNGHTDPLKDALNDLLPEQIPGLPRHRPGEYSPR